MARHLEETLQEIKEQRAYSLHDQANCGSPDSFDSEGALFLLRVRNCVVESWESDNGETEADIDNWHDVISEIAGDAPSIYTHTVWLQFVDLQGYHEDISDYGEVDGDNLESIAAVALYIIARRLAEVLFDELIEATREDAAEEADEDDDEDNFDAIALDEVKALIGAENVIE